MAYAVVSKISIEDAWRASEDNPSDEPSWLVPLRDPVPSDAVPYELVMVEAPGIVDVLTVLQESGAVGIIGPLPEASTGLGGVQKALGGSRPGPGSF